MYRWAKSGRKAARQGLAMTFVASPVWVRSVDGGLVRADSIIGLRCRAGEVEACWLGGGWLRLAGPGCPLDFDL
jgi:hypothetical protein